MDGNVLDLETLNVETFAPGPDDEYLYVAADRCTGCMSTCGIAPP